MNIIPEPKQITLTGQSADLGRIRWIFSDGLDTRVQNEAYLISEGFSDGYPVRIISKNGNCEAYTLNIKPDGAEIISDGANGAFYALQTLKQILRGGKCVKCQEITDSPDMKYRGFYHDVTRGKVPTLQTLKELADTAAEYKLNSLQLYIEHAFEFREYEFCREKLGYLTKDEIREFNGYCKSKFIDLIPSVASFGHLYHLLDNSPYSRLCEFPDYKPTEHYWQEMLPHHTINPELDESFDLIKSLIDQYTEVSESDTFNICCDETVELGNGVNRGKNIPELYIGFVKKLVSYVRSKGKKVMMWGDMLLQYPEYINELPDDVTILNWYYAPNPPEESFETIHKSGRAQIACPGTRAWISFAEDVVLEEQNITAMADYAYKYDAYGLLTTNWGDFGNLASITTSTYGLVLGAAVSWRKETRVDDDFRQSASEMIYGNREFINLSAELSEPKRVSSWYKVMRPNEVTSYSEEEYLQAIKKLKEITNQVNNLPFISDTIKREVMLALNGFSVTAAICAKIDGCEIETGIDYRQWIEEFSVLWLLRNKPSEMSEHLRIIKNG